MSPEEATTIIIVACVAVVVAGSVLLAEVFSMTSGTLGRQRRSVPFYGGSRPRTKWINSGWSSGAQQSVEQDLEDIRQRDKQRELVRKTAEAERRAQQAFDRQHTRYREFCADHPEMYDFAAWQQWDELWQAEGEKWKTRWWCQFEAEVQDAEVIQDEKSDFDALGIDPTEDPLELKTAWKDRMKEYHPDKHGMAPLWIQEEAAARAKMVNAVYQRLAEKGKTEDEACQTAPV